MPRTARKHTLRKLFVVPAAPEPSARARHIAVLKNFEDLCGVLNGMISLLQERLQETAEEAKTL